LNHLRAAGESLALNLGTGAGHSVREVIAAAERIIGRPIPKREAARRPGDPPVLVADASRVRTALGWTPRLSDLGTIIDTAWSWHRRNFV